MQWNFVRACEFFPQALMCQYPLSAVSRRSTAAHPVLYCNSVGPATSTGCSLIPVQVHLRKFCVSVHACTMWSTIHTCLQCSVHVQHMSPGSELLCSYANTPGGTVGLPETKEFLQPRTYLELHLAFPANTSPSASANSEDGLHPQVSRYASMYGTASDCSISPCATASAALRRSMYKKTSADLFTRASIACFCTSSTFLMSLMASHTLTTLGNLLFANCTTLSACTHSGRCGPVA